MSGFESNQVVLKIEDREAFTSSLAALPKSRAEKSAQNLRHDAAPAVALIGRDSFVAETATKIEQMQATIRLLSRDVGMLTGKVADLQGIADQDHRWHAFQDNERRAREGKYDEIVRCCRDLKARLDRIEPRNNGDYHAYNSFEAVSRKLAELEHYRDEAARVERKVTLRAWLFCGAMVMASSIVLVSNAIYG